MKRIFAAIKFQPNESITQLHYNLKSTYRNERINWVELFNLHLTLKFFGETEETRTPDIIKLLEKISGNHNSFQILFNEAGIFGSHYKPRVIWLGVKDNPELESLARDIIQQMEVLGFIADRQNFVPHLTLGRIKFVDNKARFFKRFQQFKQFSCEPFIVEKYHLFESKLHSNGPEYSELSSFILA